MHILYTTQHAALFITSFYSVTNDIKYEFKKLNFWYINNEQSRVAGYFSFNILEDNFYSIYHIVVCVIFNLYSYLLFTISYFSYYCREHFPFYRKFLLHLLGPLTVTILSRCRLSPRTCGRRVGARADCETRSGADGRRSCRCIRWHRKASEV